jgi:AcrR family transcriptional regulator
VDTRRRILEGALEVFAERGFDGARTRDIAMAAGVNLGLLQYYFGGKEKLWRAAVDHAFGELWETLGAPGAGGAGDAESLADLVRVAVRFAASHPALIRLMNDEGKRRGPRLRWLVEHHGRRLFEAVGVVLGSPAARARLGDVDPIHLYYVFIGATGLLFSQAPECERLVGVDPTASDAMVEAHAAVLVRLLLGPG